MSEKLEQTKADYLSKLKQVKLAEAGVSITDVDIYTKYITGDSPEEIEKQAQAVAADIKREKVIRTYMLMTGHGDHSNKKETIK